jgi:hypothetical protein
MASALEELRLSDGATYLAAWRLSRGPRALAARRTTSMNAGDSRSRSGRATYGTVVASDAVARRFTRTVATGAQTGEISFAYVAVARRDACHVRRMAGSSTAVGGSSTAGPSLCGARDLARRAQAPLAAFIETLADAASNDRTAGTGRDIYLQCPPRFRADAARRRVVIIMLANGQKRLPRPLIIDDWVRVARRRGRHDFRCASCAVVSDLAVQKSRRRGNPCLRLPAFPNGGAGHPRRPANNARLLARQLDRSRRALPPWEDCCGLRSFARSNVSKSRRIPRCSGLPWISSTCSSSSKREFRSTRSPPSAHLDQRAAGIEGTPAASSPRLRQPLCRPMSVRMIQTGVARQRLLVGQIDL